MNVLTYIFFTIAWYHSFIHSYVFSHVWIRYHIPVQSSSIGKYFITQWKNNIRCQMLVCFGKTYIMFYIIQGIHAIYYNYDDIINWKHFPRYWHLWGESTGHRWLPSQRPVTRSFDVFFDMRFEQTVEQTLETPVIWDVISLIMTSF